MRPVSDVFRYNTEIVSDWNIAVIEDEVLEETLEKVKSGAGTARLTSQQHTSVGIYSKLNYLRGMRCSFNFSATEEPC